MLEKLVNISKYAGMREDLVQAGGGNSSVKLSPEKMLIKASGYQLADVSETEGYAVVNPKVIVDFFETTPLEDIKKEDEKRLLQEAFIEGKRPSIETFLHSITGKVTLHTHAVLVDMMAARKGGMEEIRELFPGAMIVPYATPGIELAVEYFRAYHLSGKIRTDIVFLQNHGLIVSADTDCGVIQKTEEVLEKIAGELKIDYQSYADTTVLYDKFKESGFSGEIVYQAQNRRIYEAYAVFDGQSWNHVICPDCVVYCGRKILELQEGKEAEGIRDFTARYGKPVVILYRNQFYILAQSVKKAKEIESMLAFSAEIARVDMGKEMSYLTEKEQDFLLDWDAEKYRRNMK